MYCRHTVAAFMFSWAHELIKQRGMHSVCQTLYLLHLIALCVFATAFSVLSLTLMEAS